MKAEPDSPLKDMVESRLVSKTFSNEVPKMSSKKDSFASRLDVEGMEWTNWLAFSEAVSTSGPFVSKSGVYEIRAVEEGTLTPIPINRLGGADASGTLYIGQSGKPPRRRPEKPCIARRIRIFRRKHPPYLLATTKLPKHLLQARAMFLPLEEAYQEEQARLRQYKEQFGEAPPCNSNASRLRPSRR